MRTGKSSARGFPFFCLHGGRIVRKEDFVFSIGYEGNTAIVDSSARRKYGRLSAQELAAKGLYKAALCYALYDGDQEAMDHVLALYNKDTDHRVLIVEDLKRILGIAEIPTGPVKALYL